MSGHDLLDRLLAATPRNHEAFGITAMLDRELVLSANASLRANGLVPNGAIKVTARDGWITVTGDVGHYYQRLAAVHAMRQLSGLRGVYDLITVSKATNPGSSARNAGIRTITGDVPFPGADRNGVALRAPCVSSSPGGLRESCERVPAEVLG